MGLKEFFKSLFGKAQNAKLTITEFVEKNKKQIAAAMKLADQVYDANEGTKKMNAVIKFFVIAINAKCGLSIDADSVGTSATKFIEDEYQKIYENLD